MSSYQLLMVILTMLNIIVMLLIALINTKK